MTHSAKYNTYKTKEHGLSVQHQTTAYKSYTLPQRTSLGRRNHRESGCSCPAWLHYVHLKSRSDQCHAPADSIRSQTRDTTMAFWMLEGSITGDERFVQNRSDEFVSDPSIDLDEVDLNWIREHAPTEWTRDEYFYYALMNVLVCAAIGQYFEELECDEIELNKTVEDSSKTWEGVYRMKELLLTKISALSDADDEASATEDSDSE
jgi:hypothetical protein